MIVHLSQCWSEDTYMQWSKVKAETQVKGAWYLGSRLQLSKTWTSRKIGWLPQWYSLISLFSPFSMPIYIPWTDMHNNYLK